MKLDIDIDIERQIAQYNYDNAVLARKKPTSRFVVGSVLLHILSASAVIVLGQLPQPKQEIVEINYSNAQIAPIASAPEPAPQIQEAAPAVVDQSSPTEQPTPVVTESAPEPVPQQPQVPVAETKVAVEKSVVAPEKPAVKARPQSAPKKVSNLGITSQTESKPDAAPAQSSPVDPSAQASLDDIEAPALDDSEVAASLQQAEPQPRVSKADLDKKLKDAEETQAAKSAQLAQQMDQETQSAESALNGQMNETEAAVAAENAALAAQAQARADALKAASQPAHGNNTSAENGFGQETANAGPGQVGNLRTLDQLRQMPGNPKPQYAPEERLQGQQGAVIFKAFVTQEGRLQDFELLQSTGFRNLDFKTLKALKQWKFYPGQQGWVELPFKWDLKGGPQEMPTLLRRRVSQQN